MVVAAGMVVVVMQLSIKEELVEMAYLPFGVLNILERKKIDRRKEL